MNPQQRSADEFTPYRYVTVFIPQCPACESTELDTVRTEPPAGDGSKTQRKKCRECGWRFFLVWELRPDVDDSRIWNY